jgi:hypothetical protein
MNHAELRPTHNNDRQGLQCSLKTVLWITGTIAWLGGAAVLAVCVDSVRASGGTWISAGAAMIALYCWRFCIRASEANRATKMLLFAATLLIVLPYVYRYAGLIAGWARLPVSKWLGDPVWIYAVPVASFALFDLRRKSVSTIAFVLRSAVELLIIVPLWTYVWLIAQMHFGWWWM